MLFLLFADREKRWLAADLMAAMAMPMITELLQQNPADLQLPPGKSHWLHQLLLHVT